MSENDYLILEFDWIKRHRKAGSRRMFLWMIPLVFTAFIPHGWWVGPGKFLWATIYLGTMAHVLIFMTKFAWRSGRYWKVFWRHVEGLPDDLKTRATKYYGNGTDAWLAAIECHEGHFPGDCPLCGAL